MIPSARPFNGLQGTAKYPLRKLERDLDLDLDLIRRNHEASMF